MISSSAMGSKSFGRPAARLTVISVSRSRHAATKAVQVGLDRARQEPLVTTAAGDLAEEIEVAKSRLSV